MESLINIENFLLLRETHTIIDVRTPDEYDKGHIPGARNLPLFDNEQRHKVGTLYKQEGKYPAILRGLDYVGPKMSDMVRQARRLSKDKPIILYCWRGGMRSESVRWLLNTAGLQSIRLQGGYKAYRQQGKELFLQKYKLIILGGKTGSGKTNILHEIKKLGKQVIDLEGIAHHKGSAFGTIGMPVQNQNEQFENNLIESFRSIDKNNPLWLEDESKNIGRNYIPDELFMQMRNSQVIFIEVPQEARIQNLLDDYSHVDNQEIANCLNKITKRLGGNNLKEALEALENNHLEKIAEITLKYYDKAYLMSLNTRPLSQIHKKTFDFGDANKIAKSLINTAQQTQNNLLLL